MRCVMPTLLSRLAAISGLPADRLGQLVDAARRSLPLDPMVVDTVRAGLPDTHDPQQAAAALQGGGAGAAPPPCVSREIGHLPPSDRSAHSDDWDDLARHPGARSAARAGDAG